MDTAMKQGARPTRERLHNLLNPHSVVIIGASDRSAWSHFAYTNLRNGGFGGQVHLVNRRGVACHGQETFTSLAEVPGEPDLAILLTGPASLDGLFDELHEKGIRNIVVLSGGLSEIGGDGAELQRALVAKAHHNGQLFLGPNNLGYINTHAQVAAFSHMTQLPLVKGGVGVVSQSGALGIYLLPYMASRGVGVSHLVTVGNEAMLDAVDFLDFLIDDPNTKVLAAYMEQVTDTTKFRQVAQRACAAGKPIVLFKAGRAEAAIRVAAAHTGSLAGDDRIIEAVCRQYGVIRVDSIEELVATAGLLEAYGELPGDRVGFITGSGATSALIAERAELVGLQMPQFSAETVENLYIAGMPREATVNNPLDLTGATANDPLLIMRANQQLLDDKDIDVVITSGGLPRNEAYAAMMQPSLEPFLSQVASASKPLIPMELLASDQNEFSREFASKSGYPHILESVHMGVAAVAHAVRWSTRMQQLRAERGASDVRRIDVPADAHEWTEVEAGSFLRTHGVPYIESGLAKSVEEATLIAKRVGFPVALKVASKDIAHKTEVGGVRLNISDPQAVEAAFNAIQASVMQSVPGVNIRGISVTPMRHGGVELLVGVLRDPEWGLVLAVGMGGVLVELLQDSALAVLPVGKEEVRRMIESLKGAPLLGGFRGSEPADFDALVDAVHAIALVAQGLGPGLAELEINPLVVNGSRVEALDVLLRWAE